MENGFISLVGQVFSSQILGVILTLLLFFQWYKQHAKEQTVKNNLFAMRRKVKRMVNKISFADFDKSNDMIDDIDALLLTLGSRKPFRNAMDKIYSLIDLRNTQEENEMVIDIDTEKSIAGISSSELLPKTMGTNNRRSK